LEVAVNTPSSIENCKRFAASQACEVREEKLPDGTVLLTLVKGFGCEIAPAAPEKTGIGKTFFIKSDRIGNGELGKTLMQGFLKTALELERLPENIVMVNEGVFLSTKAENAAVIETLQTLAARGVKIYSCGLCLGHFGIDAAQLKVGMIGNAYDTMVMLTTTDVVSL
jgi:selenium metabolism protein YedF